MLNRLREYLFVLLVVVIVGSLWVVGWTQEMEDDIRLGLSPGPRWAALHEQTAHAD